MEEPPTSPVELLYATKDEKGVYYPLKERGALRLLKRFASFSATTLLFVQTLALPAVCWADTPDVNQTPNHQYLVDVIINRSLPQQETEDWAIDTVNNYLTRRFQEAGVNKSFKVDQVIRNYDETTGCSNIPGAKEIYDRCGFDDGKIHLWLYLNGLRYKGILIGTSADPTMPAIKMELPKSIEVEQDGYFGQRSSGDILVHEAGHLFGIPDYYNEEVSIANNRVAPVGIEPYAKDIMDNSSLYQHFSDISREYLRRFEILPAGFGEPDWSLRFTPKETILQITDDNENPIEGVKIEVFPEIMIPHEPSQRNIGTILDISNQNGQTDNNGQYSLGGYSKLFGSVYEEGDARVPSMGSAAFLRINRGGETRYTAITKSYLNYRYFQGDKEEALVSIPFSSLLKVKDGQTVYLSAPEVGTEFTENGTKSVNATSP